MSNIAALVERAKALREQCRIGVEDRGVMPDYVDACVALRHLAPQLLDALITASGTPTRRAETPKSGSVGKADGGPTLEEGDAHNQSR